VKNQEKKTGLDPNLFDEIYEGKEESLFNHFESFDVPDRPDWLIEKAKSDGVELSQSGNEFQTGMLLDTDHFISVNLGGHQIGKSFPGIAIGIMTATGMIPISLRYPKEVDTGVPRIMSPNNINRFGLQKDGTCGNIVGAGIFPKEKLPVGGGHQVWICTFKEARDKYWIPRFKKWMPEHLLDKSKGTDGYSEKKATFFFTNGNIISFITFEQDYHRVQAEKAHTIILDEEPLDRRFYTAAIDHCKYLYMFYSPINGLSWSYYDLYLPAISGQEKSIIIRHCSQYDSPYLSRKEVDKHHGLFKPYEVKAQIWGQFSAMEGKPYYTFEITRKLLKNYIPRHTYATIRPYARTDSVRDTLATKMNFQYVDEKSVDTWEIYEEYKKNGTYWLSADVAEGSEKPEEAQDKSVAYIRRLPIKDEGETDVVMVAALRTTIRNIEFAWSCLYAAIHYNYCLLAPESRGEDGGVFVATVHGYPFMYRHIVMSDVTRRQKEIQGFDTTGRTRKLAFDMVGTWLLEHVDNAKIYHKALLEEIHSCIVGKKGRPDHDDRGSTDCLMAFGISEYVYQMAKTQIRNNGKYRYQLVDNKDFGDGLIEKYKLKRETKPVLGSKYGMDARREGRINYGDRKQQLRSRLRGNSFRQTTEKILSNF